MLWFHAPLLETRLNPARTPQSACLFFRTGRGGFVNAHLVSEYRAAPRTAQ